MLYPTTLFDELAIQVTATVCGVCCTPVPARLIVGELLALLLTATFPVTAPAVVGANVITRVAVWLGVSVVPLTPVALKPAPVAPTPEIITFEFPVFVSVTFTVALLPSLTLLKLKLDGLALRS
jgi:hypothetical protein